MRMRNEGGSINPYMGVDLFMTLTLLFVFFTALSNFTPSASKEYRTPNITLPQDSKGGLAISNYGVTVSAKKDGQRVIYFINNKKVPLGSISSELKKMNVRRVALRLDGSLTNVVTVRLMNELQKAGIKETYYIFTIRK